MTTRHLPRAPAALPQSPASCVEVGQPPATNQFEQEYTCVDDVRDRPAAKRPNANVANDTYLEFTQPDSKEATSVKADKMYLEFG